MKFATQRHQLNYNLHRLAIKIAGQKHYRQLLDDMIVSQLIKRTDVPSVTGELSCKLLTDQEAVNILNELKRLLRPGYRHSRQDKAILKIAKYKFGWSNETVFNYCLNTCPEIRSRLTKYELRHPKLYIMFRLLNPEQKSKIIKRLVIIEKKNENQKLPCQRG